MKTERLERIDKLTSRVERTDKAIKITTYGALGLLVLALALIVVQLFMLSAQVQHTLVQNQQSGAANHAKTRAYIKCIAAAQLLPLAQRTEASFDACTDEAT